MNLDARDPAARTAHRDVFPDVGGLGLRFSALRIGGANEWNRGGQQNGQREARKTRGSKKHLGFVMWRRNVRQAARCGPGAAYRDRHLLQRVESALERVRSSRPEARR